MQGYPALLRVCTPSTMVTAVAAGTNLTRAIVRATCDKGEPVMPGSSGRTSFGLKASISVVSVIALIGLGSLVFLGGQTSTILSTVGSPIDSSAGEVTDPASASDGDASSGSDIVPARAVVDVARPDLLVIRTGTIELQVVDVQRAVDEAGHDIEAVGGYVSGSEQVGDGSGLTATATYRIPVAAWEDVLAGLRALATRVVSAETHTEDVTAQVVDLSARIVNLRATEHALQGIMAKATKTSDVLDVQAELTTVRGQIEETTAQRQQFEDQAAFSTLTATFGLKPLPAVVATQNQYDPQSEVDKATARLVRVVQRAVTAGIWFGIVWLPILLVVGLVLGIAMVLTVRARRAAEMAG
jgi:Domain of unknown function (DUF4349)